MVFDLDGTLVDSRVAVIDAVAAGIREVAARHDRGPVTIDPARLRAALGKPAHEYFVAVLDETLREFADEVKEASTAHEVAALASGEGRLFPGVLDTLDALRVRGFALGVVSNAQAPYFRAALEHLDLNSRLTHSECYEELPDGAARPFKHTMLRRALHSMGVEPARAWMVGDRREDIEAGHALGTRTAGILFGFGTPDEFDLADQRLQRFDALLSVEG
jgi:phosphoglycolate phosphatase